MITPKEILLRLRTRVGYWLILFLFIPFAGGCFSTQASSGLFDNYRLLYSSSNCSIGNRGPEAFALTDRHQVFSFCGGCVDAESISSIDFNEQIVVVLTMGQQSRGGYGLSLADTPQVKGVINIVWQEPSTDALTTMVVTHPCLFFSLPKPEITQLKIIDQNGKTRMILDLQKRLSIETKPRTVFQ